MDEADTDTPQAAEPAAPEDARPVAVDLPTRVVLRGRDGELAIHLVPPKSQALRYEVVFAAVESEANAVGAALGLCSVSIRKHVRWSHDVHAFGQAVFDWLLERGVRYRDILAAGRVAWVHLREGLVFEGDVKAAEGFSVPGTAASTS